MVKWGKVPESLCLVVGVFFVWNEEGSHGYRRGMMTVLDKIKSFFKQAKPPEAPREKPDKTTELQKKAPKATRKKAPRPSKRKRAG